MTAKQTHKNLIIWHMRTFGSITPMDAWNEYHCTKLATRVSELKREGWNIIGERTDSVNKYGHATHYMTYRLKEGQ